MSYDTAGNLVLDNKGYSYKWDHENHLVAIYKNNGTTLIAEFVYDALGRRVRKLVRVPDSSGYIQTDYYYNGWQVLTEVVTGADLDVSTVNYAYGNQLDEVLFYVTEAGEAETVSYLVHDHLNSPVARIDSSGAILERYEYDAYGKRKVYNAGYSSQLAAGSGTNIGFTGQRVEYFDNNALELCYYKNRWYYPAFGRMLSIDPLGYIDGLNLYQYVKSSPLCYTDKLGLATTYSAGIYLGIGASADITTDVDYKPCCMDGVHYPNGMKKMNISANAHVGIGVGGNIGDWNLTWKWMQIDIGVADLEIKNKKCNGPYQSACDTKSLGVNLGQSINLGASAFGFDLVTLVGQIDIKGQIKSTVCGGPEGISMEVKFCGVVDGELSLNLIGADPVNVNMSDYYAEMIKDGEGCYSAFNKTWRFD